MTRDGGYVIFEVMVYNQPGSPLDIQSHMMEIPHLQQTAVQQSSNSQAVGLQYGLLRGPQSEEALPGSITKDIPLVIRSKLIKHLLASWQHVLDVDSDRAIGNDGSR